MSEQEKQLLLQDLSARLPYGVFVEYDQGNGVKRATKFHGNYLYLIMLGKLQWKDFKPYLRPISSMTEEEKKIMKSCGFEPILYDTGYTGFANIESYIGEVSFRFMEAFLNSRHFDYRDLIPMGLAVEAPEGMYYIKTE